jgi:coenzyme F420-reducing hydrogenase beta subunit
MYSEYSNHDVNVYAGYLDSDQKIMESASGGIATALSEHVIKNGGYVAGVSYSEDFHSAEYLITNNLVDLDKLKGSKYCETNKGAIYKEVKALLDQEKQVLFIGLPCIVGALYHFVGGGNRPDNLITCELICHGPTSQKVHEEYISHLEKKFRSKITKFSVRHKKTEWTPPYLRAEFENGKVFERPFYETEYGVAFRILGRESCYNCAFKGNNRCGDLMIGDFWGATKKDEFWNKHGVSVIFAETEKGDYLLNQLKNVVLYKTDFETAVRSNHMVIESKKKHANRDKFGMMFSEKGLFYAANHSLSKKTKVVRIIRHMIPKPLLPCAKRLYHLLRS